MYVILTSKPTQFRTELVDGVRALETYDYMFYGQKKAVFTIAELEREVKVRVIDETPPAVVNNVPSKFLEKFDTVEEAREELNHLTTFGHMETVLKRVA